MVINHKLHGNRAQNMSAPRVSAPKPEDVKLAHSRTKSLKGNEKKTADPWYSGVFTSFFGSSAVEDDRNCSDSRVGVACRKERAPDPNARLLPIARQDAPPNIPPDEIREDIEDESTSSETVSTLGKGVTDDLQSLPSIQGGVLPDEDGSISLDDNINSPRWKEAKTTQGSNRASNSESVESLIEKKINNLKAERATGESLIAPFLQSKLFPISSTRTQNSTKASTAPDSVLESRRQLLVRELRGVMQMHGRFDIRCANITAALGDLYEENGDYKQALRLHKDAVSVYTIKLGDDHDTTIAAKIRLGDVEASAGAYDDSIGTFHSALCVTKALKGEKSAAAADMLAKIASSLRKRGKCEQAIKTLKRGLKIYREALGDSDVKVSTTVDAIASLYVTIGDFEKASAILEEVVKLKAATVGVTSKEVAASLAELATCYECAEQYSKAMKNLKKSYKISALIEGEAGGKAILTLERIALIYQATGQFKKAAIAYLGVLRGRKRALGESHPTVADTYFHLGVSLRESGQQDKAIKCMKQALNIYVGEGRDMHDVEMIAEVMHELAMIHKINKNLADAVKTFKQEVAVRRKIGQPEFPLIAQSLNHLGVAEFESKNYSRALNHFMEALSIYENRGTPPGPDFAEVLYNTGLVFEAMKNKKRAQDAFLEATRMFIANGYSADHPHLLKASNKLRKLGHVCRCKQGACGSTPCKSYSPNAREC